MKNIYVHVFSRNDLKLCEELEKIDGLNIAVIETHHELIKEIKEIFPKKYIFTGYSILNEKIINLINNRKGKRYYDSTKFIVNNYLILCHLYSRNLIHTELSLVDRDIFFDECYQFCNFIFDEYKIDCCLFMNEPHQVHDYIFQKIAEMRKKSFVIQKTSLEGYSVLRNTKNNEIVECPSRKNLHLKINDINKHFCRILGNKQKLDSRTLKRTNIEKRSIYDNFLLFTVSQIISQLKEYIIIFVKTIVIDSRDFLLFRKLFSIPFKIIKQRILIGRNYIKTLSNQKFNEQRYIFFPLQCSPERQTMPAGMPYFSQLNLLKKISNLMKLRSQKVFIKEHPSQHKLYQKNYLGRSKLFYEIIKEDQYMQLLSSDHDSFELIDSSDAVIGIGGSTCWESIIRGKSTIVFGKPWYLGINTNNAFFNPNLNKFKIDYFLNNDIKNSNKISHTNYLKEWLIKNLWGWDSITFSNKDLTNLLAKKIASCLN